MNYLYSRNLYCADQRKTPSPPHSPTKNPKGNEQLHVQIPFQEDNDSFSPTH